jgi:hypothetical protein
MCHLLNPGWERFPQVPPALPVRQGRVRHPTPLAPMPPFRGDGTVDEPPPGRVRAIAQRQPLYGREGGGPHLERHDVHSQGRAVAASRRKKDATTSQMSGRVAPGIDDIRGKARFSWRSLTRCLFYRVNSKEHRRRSQMEGE